MLVGERERHSARSGADVEDARRVVTVEQREAALDEGLGLGARDERAPVDAEREAPEAPLAEDVLERLAGRPAPDERARAVELGDRQRPVEVHVQLDALEPERVREELLGFEARPPGAPCREMVGRPPEDLSDGHITRLPRVPAGGPRPGASR